MQIYQFFNAVATSFSALSKNLIIRPSVSNFIPTDHRMTDISFSEYKIYQNEVI